MYIYVYDESLLIYHIKRERERERERERGRDIHINTATRYVGKSVYKLYIHIRI